MAQVDIGDTPFKIKGKGGRRTVHSPDGDQVGFLEKSASGWWHGYFMDSAPVYGYSSRVPGQRWRQAFLTLKEWTNPKVWERT